MPFIGIDSPANFLKLPTSMLCVCKETPLMTKEKQQTDVFGETHEKTEIYKINDRDVLRTHNYDDMSVLSIKKQLNFFKRFLSKDFPHISFDKAYELSDRISNTFPGSEQDGWFVIIWWRAFDKESYASATQKMLSMTKTSKILSSGNGILKNVDIRKTKLSTEMLDYIANVQKSDVLILSSQLGKRYAGIPQQYAPRFFRENEFAIGLFESVCIVSSHPDRFLKHDSLGIDCSGDECIRTSGSNNKIDYKFNSTPSLIRYGDEIRWLNDFWIEEKRMSGTITCLC